jgi:hypothetical protein
MEATSSNEGMKMSSTIFYFAIAVLVAVLVGLVTYALISRMNTLPFGASGNSSEGFQGPANGVSHISCGQESAEAVALCEMFVNRESTSEEGSADLSELKLILSKLCCMKHDLMGVSQSVQSTLYLPYITTHDRENTSDTVARCFAKAIPPRDLDITFGTWKDRATVLLNKLCTSYNFSSSEVDKANGLFNTVWMDTFSIAKNACSPPKRAPEYESPRDPKGFVGEKIKDLGPYNGYY